jgi:hypothetical protein
MSLILGCRAPCMSRSLVHRLPTDSFAQSTLTMQRRCPALSLCGLPTSSMSLPIMVSFRCIHTRGRRAHSEGSGGAIQSYSVTPSNSPGSSSHEHLELDTRSATNATASTR